MITDIDSAVRALNSKSDFEEELLDVLKKHYKPIETSKSKGDVRFIENHRMKLWCDAAVKLIDNEAFNNLQEADHILAAFDKRFNNK